MSDLSLLAAALARVAAADQPNANQPEVPVIAGLSSQTKHQAVQPIALQLHQASIETYRAEFSRGARPANDAMTDSSHSDAASLEWALPIEVISTPQSQSRQPNGLASPAASPGRGLTEAMFEDISSDPAPLSLRPIITPQGGSIAALSPKIRPIALGLHQASIEIYATALAPKASQATIGQASAKESAGLADVKVAAAHRSKQSMVTRKPVTQQSATKQPGAGSAIATESAEISLIATAKLSPAALSLGMAQAAGAAQGVEDASRLSASQGTGLSEVISLLDAAPLGGGTTAAQTPEPEEMTAVQAAIALDQQVRAELAEEEAVISQATRLSAADSPLWASSGTASGSTSGNAGNIIQLPPETVARAQAAPGTVAAAPEPTISISPGAKQAVASPTRRTVTPPITPPALSPWQRSQPGTRLGANLGPRSGPQLYQQRLAALKQGRLYSRLPIDSFKAIWQGVRHKPSYGQWKRLLAAEARAVGGGQGNNNLSVVLGDSLSLWLPMQQLPSSQLWLNQGISGDTTAGILKRLEPLKATDPSNIYVMAGVNDLKNGATDDQVAGNLQKIMSQLRRQHPRAKIHIQSILPASIGLPPGRIQRLNGRIARLAQQEQVAFLDIYPQFAAPNGQMMAQLTTDGIHLSPQGYALWQSILHRMVEPWAFANRGGVFGRS